MEQVKQSAKLHFIVVINLILKFWLGLFTW